MKMTEPDQSRRLDELSSLDGGARSLNRPANDYGEFAVAEFDNRAEWIDYECARVDHPARHRHASDRLTPDMVLSPHLRWFAPGYS